MSLYVCTTKDESWPRRRKTYAAERYFDDGFWFYSLPQLGICSGVQADDVGLRDGGRKVQSIIFRQGFGFADHTL